MMRALRWFAVGPAPEMRMGSVWPEAFGARLDHRRLDELDGRHGRLVVCWSPPGPLPTNRWCGSRSLGHYRVRVHRPGRLNLRLRAARGQSGHRASVPGTRVHRRRAAGIRLPGRRSCRSFLSGLAAPVTSPSLAWADDAAGEAAAQCSRWRVAASYSTSDTQPCSGLTSLLAVRWRRHWTPGLASDRLGPTMRQGCSEPLPPAILFAPFPQTTRGLASRALFRPGTSSS